MPLVDVPTQNAWLDAGVATFPVDAEVRQYTGYPDDTNELTSEGGYAPAPLGTWAAAVDGAVETAAPVDYGIPTGDGWSDDPAWWAICATDGTRLFVDQVTADDTLDGEAGVPQAFTPRLYYYNPMEA